MIKYKFFKKNQKMRLSRGKIDMNEKNGFTRIFKLFFH